MDIYVDTLSPLGFILVGFHDIRCVASMIEQGSQELGVSPFFVFPAGSLDVRPLFEYRFFLRPFLVRT